MFQRYVDSIIRGNIPKHVFTFYQDLIDEIVNKEIAINMCFSQSQQSKIETLIESTTESL